MGDTRGGTNYATDNIVFGKEHCGFSNCTNAFQMLVCLFAVLKAAQYNHDMEKLADLFSIESQIWITVFDLICYLAIFILCNFENNDYLFLKISNNDRCWTKMSWSACSLAKPCRCLCSWRVQPNWKINPPNFLASLSAVSRKRLKNELSPRGLLFFLLFGCSAHANLFYFRLERVSLNVLSICGFVKSR